MKLTEIFGYARPSNLNVYYPNKNGGLLQENWPNTHSFTRFVVNKIKDADDNLK